MPLTADLDSPDAEGLAAGGAGGGDEGRPWPPLGTDGVARAGVAGAGVVLGLGRGVGVGSGMVDYGRDGAGLGCWC